jgi:hypothetical protein
MGGHFVNWHVPSCSELSRYGLATLTVGTAAHHGLKPDAARTIAGEVSAALFGGTRDRLPRRGVPAGVKSTSRILEGWTTKRGAIAIINRNCDSSTAATRPEDVLGSDRMTYIH